MTHEKIEAAEDVLLKRMMSRDGTCAPPVEHKPMLRAVARECKGCSRERPIFMNDDDDYCAICYGKGD